MSLSISTLDILCVSETIGLSFKLKKIPILSNCKNLGNDETKTIVINSLNIDFEALDENQLFPNTFKVDFTAIGKNFSIKLVRIPKDKNYPIGTANINTVKSGSVVRFKIDESEDEVKQIKIYLDINSFFK